MFYINIFKQDISTRWFRLKVNKRVLVEANKSKVLGVFLIKKQIKLLNENFKSANSYIKKINIYTVDSESMC